jgi:hypothetical protein
MPMARMAANAGPTLFISAALMTCSSKTLFPNHCDREKNKAEKYSAAVFVFGK